jgi:hypothetical protein
MHTIFHFIDQNAVAFFAVVSWAQVALTYSAQRGERKAKASVVHLLGQIKWLEQFRAECPECTRRLKEAAAS